MNLLFSFFLLLIYLFKSRFGLTFYTLFFFCFSIIFTISFFFVNCLSFVARVSDVHFFYFRSDVSKQSLGLFSCVNVYVLSVCPSMHTISAYRILFQFFFHRRVNKKLSKYATEDESNLILNSVRK